MFEYIVEICISLYFLLRFSSILFFLVLRSFVLCYSVLTEKLKLEDDNAEKWLVNLIRNTHLDAKIDSEHNLLTMRKTYPSPYVIYCDIFIHFYTSLFLVEMSKRKGKWLIFMFHSFCFWQYGLFMSCARIVLDSRYQNVIDKTKGVVFRSQILASNVEKAEHRILNQLRSVAASMEVGDSAA